MKGVTKHIKLYDRPGDDYRKNKGDLWKIRFGSFGFRCVKIKEIECVYIVEGSNDGWNIDSIVTLVKDSSRNSQILTSDLDVFRWIDGNGLRSHKRFLLSFV